MTTNAGVRKMIKGTIAAMAAMLLILGPCAAQAGLVDITALPGYGVATSASLNFNAAGGWAGWSVPTGKVVLGAKIISPGDSFLDFATFRPAGPGEVFPHYKYGVNEYGWVMQAKYGQVNNGVKMELYYADPLAGYTITPSIPFNYNGAGGYAGWSAPSGDVVSGGGYQFMLNSAAVPQFAMQSALALEGSVWPHYTFGANEQGWVVQGPNNGYSSNVGNVYVVSFDAQAVPIPAAVWLLGTGIVGLAALRRRMQK